MAEVVLLVWLVVTLLAVIFWIVNRKKVRKLKEAVSQLENERDILSTTLQESQERLEAYRPIMDAEEEAKKILESAQAEETDASERAKQIIEEGRKHAAQDEEAAKAVLVQAKGEQERIKRKIELDLDEAYHKAREIVAAAKTKAEEIAGDAYRAQNRVKEYEHALKSLKNTIEGYGDEYIVPSQSVLDGLADEFGFTEAGEKLKEARARTKSMIKEGKAAACDYVEENRRKTAESFVIDAFNGKVDTTLSKVKVDNFGKLRQEIEDAFTLVNLNGQAFRNARITPAYRDARIDELKWGVAVVVLREQEREEQRAIKERIREEERARREYERAMRDAAKDEEKLQAAMEKARAELAKANEAQKAKYEQQLAALSAKLEEAEAKSQRALSMAQQTRSGHVYVISNIGSFGEDVFKIGMTRRLDPLDRVRELGDASVPFAFDVHAMIYSDDAPTLENALHKKFNDLRLNKVNPRKEFFRINLAAIREVAKEMGVTAHFTLKAEAQEYRESLAMEKLPSEEKERRLQVLLNREIEDEEV